MSETPEQEEAKLLQDWNTRIATTTEISELATGHNIAAAIIMHGRLQAQATLESAKQITEAIHHHTKTQKDAIHTHAKTTRTHG